VGGTAPFNAVAWRHDGAALASTGENGKVVLWDPATGAPIRELGPFAKMAQFVAFSPDGKFVAAGGK
jgi:WD40 repeat protein